VAAFGLLAAGARGASHSGGEPVTRSTIRSIARLDIEGGGMVDVQGGLAVVGHMAPPHATSILDVSDPRNPREVSRWWMPGQWTAGGEKTAGTVSYRIHHANRTGDRLYAPLWMGGFAVVDISEITKPRAVSHTNYARPSDAPTHTALPVGHAILGRKWLLVFDEEMGGGDPPAFMRIFDITDESRPVQVSAYRPARAAPPGVRFGAHQSHEFVGSDNLVYAAWFAGGLRIIDIANPQQPNEVDKRSDNVERGVRGDPPLPGRHSLQTIDALELLHAPVHGRLGVAGLHRSGEHVHHNIFRPRH
jgi:hypothetical protein